MPVDAHASLIVLAAQLQAVQTMIGSIEKRVVGQHRSNEESKRLETIPGIGVIGATAIAAGVPDPKVFRSGRDFAAWIGLVPREDSTGGKQKLGRSRNRATDTSAHPGRWSLFRLAACAPAAGEVSLAHTASRPATVQGRCGRACQQDGAGRLGVAGQGRHLPGASTNGGLTRSSAMGEDEVASVRSRTAGVMTTLMRNGRDRRSGKPVKCHARKERVRLFGTRSADYIRASGQSGCIQRPNTWLHPNASLKCPIFPLHRGRRPYMARWPCAAARQADLRWQRLTMYRARDQ